MKRIILLPLLCMCLMVSAQSQELFMDQHTALVYAHSKDLKGKFILENESGESYYECNKPLFGYRTMVVQSSSSGKIIVRAVPNEVEPLPPVLENILSQLTRTGEILGSIKKDSESDAPLRDYLRKLPKVKRIIVFADRGGSPSTTFYINKTGEHMIDIIPVD